MSPSESVAIGLVLGMRHALDPDHVVAMSTMVGRTGRVQDAVRAGALWGLGHSLTVLVVGLGIGFFGLRFTGRAEVVVELLVAAMLVVLGLSALFARAPSAVDNTESRTSTPAVGARRMARPVIVGLVHGLAGSAGLSLVAMTTLPTRATALLYLVLFGLGTVVAMASATALLSLPALYFRRTFASLVFVRAAGVLGTLCGALIALRVVRGH
jgi:nickel/cobalt transporter (NicO) family protein